MTEGPIATAFVEIKGKLDTSDFGRQVSALTPVASRGGHAAAEAFEKNFKIDASGRVRTISGQFASIEKVARTVSKAAYDDFHGAFDRMAASARVDTERIIASLDRIGRSATQNAAQARTSLAAIGGATHSASNEVGFLSSRYSALPRVIRQAEIAAVASLGVIAGFGVKAAASLEQTQVAFTGLLGSQPAADAFIKRLQDFAAVTPFEFQDLAKSTQKLIALGKTGEQAISILTDIGNAAAAAGADGQSINRVTLAITQMQAKGKFLSEELNQVAEALPNLNRADIFENLAKNAGVTTEHIKMLAEKGAIPAEEGIAALLQTMREVPGAMGAMDRQALTLIGRFSTFKDTIKQDFSNSLQDSIPIISKSLGSLTTVIDEQLKSFGPALGDFIGTVTPLIEGVVKALGPIATSLLDTLGPALAALAPALEPLGLAISSILDALGPALTTLAGGFATLVQAAAPFITVLADQLGPVLATVAKALVQMIETLLPQFQAVLTPLSSALGPFVEALGSILVAIIPLIPQLTQMSLALIPSLTAAVIALTPVLNLVALLLGKLGPLFSALLFPITIASKAIGFFRDLLLETIEVILRVAAKAASFVPFSHLDDDLNAAADSIDAFKQKIDSTDLSVTIPVAVKFVGITTGALDQEFSGLGSGSGFPTFSKEDIAKITQPVKDVVNTAGSDIDRLLKDTDKKTGSATNKAADKALAAAKKAADAAVKNAQTVADGIRKQYDKAREGLQKLKDQFAEIRKTVADAFNIDAFEAKSARQLAGRLGVNIAKNRTVLQAQKSLTGVLGNRAGGAQFLQQLFESGNTRLIQSLAGQSSAALADILARFNQNNALATKIGTAVAASSKNGNVLITTAIKTQTSLVDRLRKELLAALAKLTAATQARERLNAAAGGYFTSATKLNVAEAGREVVLPFARPGRMQTLIKESGLLNHPVMMKMMMSHPDFGRPALPTIKTGAPHITLSATRGSAAPRLVSTSSPVVKVVKERTVHLEQHIHGADDPQQTADRMMSRLAAWSER